MTFVLLTSFIITIFVIVVDWIVGFIQSEGAAKRPRLELWGLSTNSWLGSVHHRKQGDRSLVVAAIFSNSYSDYPKRRQSTSYADYLERRKSTSYGDTPERRKSTSYPGTPERRQSTSYADYPERRQSTSYADYPERRKSTSYPDTPERRKSSSYPDTPERRKSCTSSELRSQDRVKAFQLRESESDYIAREIFKNSLTPRIECIRLMTQVEEFLIGETSESNPWDISQDASGQSAEHLAAMKAISSKLMVNYDGTLKPITFRQKFFYKDRQDLIEKKLAAARVQADKVCDSIVGMKVDDDNLKDMMLVRKFILEQVSIFYRFSLDRSFSNYNGAPPEGVNPTPWLLAWIFIIVIHLFFLYWVFAWCVKNSGGTMNLWGTDYGVTLVQDIFISEVGKVCIMYVFAMMSVRPQLQVIKRIINDRALKLVQDEVNCKDGVSVVQHFSPACRAARLSGLSKLPAAAILRSITDDDVEKCREHKNFTLGTFIFYVITIAAIVAMVSEALIDQLLSTILSSLWLMFLLVHERLAAISPLLLIGIYCVVAGALLYYFLVFIPSVRRARKISAIADNPFMQRKSRTSNMREGRMHIHRLMRRAMKLYHYFLETIGHCHAAVIRDRSQQRRKKHRQASLSWCDMNRPQLDHGYVVSISEAILVSQSPGNLYSARKMARRLTEYMIPPYILSMRQSGSTFTRVEIAAAEVNFLSYRVPGPTHIHPMGPESNTIPAVQSSFYSGKLARMFQANSEITTDSQVALKRMLCRHLIGAESYSDGEECSVFDLHGALNDYISMADLMEMLSWTWNLFYPSGQELSSVVKAEINDLFHSWWKSPTRVAMCIYNGADSETYFKWATFSEFSDWFLDICGYIEYSCAPSRQDEQFGYIDCPHRLN